MEANLNEEAVNDQVKSRTHEAPNFLDTHTLMWACLLYSSTKLVIHSIVKSLYYYTI